MALIEPEPAVPGVSRPEGRASATGADEDLRPTIGELFKRLTDEATSYVRAEVALYRAQAGQKALSAGLIAGLFGGALLLAQGAVIALLVGLIMALAATVGIWWAISVVVGATFVVAGALIKLGLNRVTALLEGGDTP